MLELDVLAGIRYLDLETDVTLDLSAFGGSKSAKFSEDGSLTDGIVGIKGIYAVGQSWSIPFYADIGTGDSDVTWQVSTGVFYHATKTVDLALMYRHLEWDVGNDLLDDLNFSGPLLGAIFRL
jgi:hypothetical protein